MATQWPRVKSALVALLPTLSGWPQSTLVFNGPPVSGESASYATVGYVDGQEDAGSFSTDTRNDYRTSETGSVIGELVTWAGDTDMASRESEAFAAMDSLQQALRADRTLGGVLSADSTATLTVTVVPSQTTAGAVHRLRFSLDYTTNT